MYVPFFYQWIPRQYGYYPLIPFPRTYPPVDIKSFQSSVQSFRLLMQEGSRLLGKLAETKFEKLIMTAAQQGKQAEVDNLIKSIGLKVPVTTTYTPTGVRFTLHSPPAQDGFGSCCSLTIFLGWGQ
jgi:hypothetical protein